MNYYIVLYLVEAIGTLRSKSSLLKLPIFNVHAYSNARVHQITKLKITKAFYG